MGIHYCAREDVRAALDIKESYRSNAEIDRIIETSSRNIENLTNRLFYPQIATKYFDYPAHNYSRSYRLWFFEPGELIRATSVVTGGTTLAPTDYYLEPINTAPPYDRLEINLAGPAAFNASSTFQRATVVTGVWGYQEDLQSVTTLSATINSSVTSLAIPDSSVIGVGDLIQLDDEYMNVTNKSMVTTGQVCSALTANANNVSITGITAGTINVGETILIDSERMLVTDVAGTTITVSRAYDGTILAVHNVSTTIYAPRTLTVQRAQLGTTAASHTQAVAVEKFMFPGPIRELAIAESLNTLLQSRSGYARTIGSGDNMREAYGKGLSDLRNQVKLQYGKRSRKMAV